MTTKKNNPGFHTPERLKEHKGPKLAKWLRRDVIQHFHALYDKAMLLKIVDPEFEQELEKLNLNKALDMVTKVRTERMNSKSK